MQLTYLPKGCRRTLIAKRVKHYTGLKILRPRKKLTFHNSLPIDIMKLIYNNLDEKSIKNLSCVSRFFNSSLEHKFNKFKEYQEQKEQIKKLIEYQKIFKKLNNFNFNYYNDDNYYNNYYIMSNRYRFYNERIYKKYDITVRNGYNKYNPSKKSKKKYSKNIQKDFNMIKNIQLKKKAK